ncbi:hypothetical protein M768_15200 [Cellulosimicrobium cellulans F16]|uniref:Uncharacterized protein n=1 Tax=Cellulosimicrobium cellulans F16 TaxID=1350482 RepID=A0A0M0F551_CELCE|nr:hypothetical protein [Cellulosimicrobium cellulans]KON72316.1 hypothetical protein M768_15200 [Cellulosimicrobium cellulans F16]
MTGSAADDALVAATERVAGLFGDAPAAADETGCGRCFSEAELLLLRTPGVAVPRELAVRAAGKDPSHWDDQPAMIRRVLPTAVRALADGESEPYLIARGLAAAGWSTWPAPQSSSIREFLDAWWTATPRREASLVRVVGVFEACVVATGKVQPWLDVLDREARTSVHASRHRDACRDDWRYELSGGTFMLSAWWQGSWDDEQAAVAELERWCATAL